MTTRADPYRVLGLVPGATAGEIRSAYRRLAKIYHPDKAGDRSLPRFLAIQAAYEVLVDGEGNLRARGWPTKGAPAARPASPTARGASRDAWRARQEAPNADAPKTGAGPKAGDGPKAEGGGTKAGPKRPTDGARRASGTRRTSERRTAKPGSTTYDEATQPLDPSWDGAGWYGASSGRYWTLNPKEYADPRKHGPEYQERAKRAAKIEAQLRARRTAGEGAAFADGEPSPPGSPPSPPQFAHFGPPPPSAAGTPPPGPRPRGFARRPG